jgi:hypothetical protein
MGSLLLHDSRIQFYLLFVGVLWIAVKWDYLRNPPAGGDNHLPGPQGRRRPKKDSSWALPAARRAAP